MSDLDVRPRTSAAWALSCSALVLVGFAVFAAMLPRSTTADAPVQWSDRIAMFGLGVALSALIAVPAWPRVRADAFGVRSRGFFGGYRSVSWSEVRGIDFRGKAHWASLQLAHEELLPLYAVQKADGDRAIAAMRQLRAMYAAYGAGEPERTERSD